MPSPEPLSFSGRSLLDLVAALGLSASDLVEDLDTVKLRQSEQRLASIEQGRGKKGEGEERLFSAGSKIAAALAAYGGALSGFLKLNFSPKKGASLQEINEANEGLQVWLKTVLDEKEFKDLYDAFKTVQEPQLVLHLEIDKRTLVAAALQGREPAIPSDVRPTLVMLSGTLARLFGQDLNKIEAWWSPGAPKRLVILAPEWEYTLNGRYLAVAGGDPTVGWPLAVSAPSGSELAPPEDLDPNAFLEIRRNDLRWEADWVEHLTPLHLAVEGQVPAGEPVAKALRAHFVNLCLLYTADRSERNDGGWRAVYSGAGERAIVNPATSADVVDDKAVQGTEALTRIVWWAYQNQLRADRLDYLQSAVARVLRPFIPDPDKEKETERSCRSLLLRAKDLSGRLDQDWKLFIEGRLEKFGAQVRALEEDVAKTVESFSSQIAAMVKSLSDTMIGAVAVLLGAFIAALVKEELRLEILAVTVAVYVIYLLTFPLTFNMRERGESYEALAGQFNARCERYKSVLSEKRVADIVGNQVSRSEERFKQWFRRVKITYVTVASLLVGGVLLAWILPKVMVSPIDAVAYTARPALPLAGSLEPNEVLRTAQPVGQDRLFGAEDVAVDAAGRLYTGTEDGRIVRVTRTPDGREILETLADTGGRPLGLRFGPAGKTLFVADAKKGLLAVDEAGGIKPLATRAGGVSFGFTNDLDVAPDGTIYFSDASSRFGVDEYLYDLLEARPHGRLLRYDPKAQKDKVSILLDGLYFANGVALAKDQSFVLVNETYRYQIRRYWLKGPKVGASDLFVKDLPGFPDNLSRDPATGRFWVALYTVRNPALELFHPHPFLKNQLAKLPRFLWPKPEPYGLVLEIDEQGRIVESLHDPGGESVRTVTSVEPYGGKLYLGSLHGPIAAWEP